MEKPILSGDPFSELVSIWLEKLNTDLQSSTNKEEKVQHLIDQNKKLETVLFSCVHYVLFDLFEAEQWKLVNFSIGLYTSAASRLVSSRST